MSTEVETGTELIGDHSNQWCVHHQRHHQYYHYDRYSSSTHPEEWIHDSPTTSPLIIRIHLFPPTHTQLCNCPYCGWLFGGRDSGDGGQRSAVAVAVAGSGCLRCSRECCGGKRLAAAASGSGSCRGCCRGAVSGSGSGSCLRCDRWQCSGSSTVGDGCCGVVAVVVRSAAAETVAVRSAAAVAVAERSAVAVGGSGVTASARRADGRPRSKRPHPSWMDATRDRCGNVAVRPPPSKKGAGVLPRRRRC